MQIIRLMQTSSLCQMGFIRCLTSFWEAAGPQLHTQMTCQPAEAGQQEPAAMFLPLVFLPA